MCDWLCSVGVCALTLAAAGPARAVEKGQLGFDLEVGERRLVAARYQLDDSLGLRLGVFFQRVQAENTPTLLDPTQEVPIFETEDTSIGGQIEVDHYFAPYRDLAPYLAVVGTLSHVNSPYPFAREDGTTGLRNGSLQNWSIGAGFGAQYAFSRSFHVFGRVGLSYARTQRFTLNGTKLHSSALTTSTSAVGVAFYLR